jgi:hypothetical protein
MSATVLSQSARTVPNLNDLVTARNRPRNRLSALRSFPPPTRAKLQSCSRPTEFPMAQTGLPNWFVKSCPGFACHRPSSPPGAAQLSGGQPDKSRQNSRIHRISVPSSPAGPNSCPRGDGATPETWWAFQSRDQPGC